MRTLGVLDLRRIWPTADHARLDALSRWWAAGGDPAVEGFAAVGLTVGADECCIAAVTVAAAGASSAGTWPVEFATVASWLRLFDTAPTILMALLCAVP
ncbi:MAG: hypothetical protein JWL97_4379 [Gemmatimonadales bacterium]|jgi:hypothetical protein|nr:hypothetical protein [Gemmatimonadales bacterium]